MSRERTILGGFAALSINLMMTTMVGAQSFDRVSREEPELDCKNGGNTTFEIISCAKEEQNKAEDEQSRYWAAARYRFVENAHNPGDEEGDAKDAIEDFDSAQSSWRLFRDSHCASVSYDYRGGSISGVLHGDCLVRLTRERTWQIWKYWLHHADSTLPLLPEPKRGRDWEHQTNPSDIPPL